VMVQDQAIFDGVLETSSAVKSAHPDIAGGGNRSGPGLCHVLPARVSSENPPCLRSGRNPRVAWLGRGGRGEALSGRATLPIRESLLFGRDIGTVRLRSL